MAGATAAKVLRDLTGNVAVITGGAQGIGKALTTAFLQRGGKVMIADLNPETGDTTCRQLQDKFGRGNVDFFELDVTNHERLAEMYRTTLKTFSRLDVVCNNAGVGFEVENSGPDMWRKTIDINLTALIDSSYLAKHYMDEANGGHGGTIVNIASMGGLQAMPFNLAYSASKHGVVGFVRGTMYWPDQYGVHVYAMCPGFVNTDMVQSGLQNEAFADAVKAGGILQPEKVAEGFIKLLDERPQSGKCMRITVQKGIDYQKFHVPRSKV